MTKLGKIVSLGAGHWVYNTGIFGVRRPKKIRIVNMEPEDPRSDTKKFLTLTDSSFS